MGKYFMKKITNDWLLSAESDILIIERIIGQENLTHQAAFHAQQAIEKSFKAVIEEFDLGFIKTHSLETLYYKVVGEIKIELNTDQLILLDKLYIDARYPGELGLLPDGKPSFTEAEEFYNFAKLVFKAVNSACS